MRILSRIIFVAMLAMAVIIIPLGAATIIMAIELGLLFEALSGMLMLCVYIALSLYEVREFIAETEWELQEKTEPEVMSLTLYLEAATTIPDLFIDYIEVRLASGESASLNWDESEIYRNPNGFGAKYKGVYFGEEPANGRLDELCDMVITDIGLYSDTIPETKITISEMEFVDNGRNLEFSPPENCIQEDGHVDEKQ